MTYQASRDPLALGEVVEMAAADRGERGGSAELGDGVRGAAAAGDRGDTRAFGSGGDVGAVIVGAPPSGREHRRVDKPGRFTRTRVVGRDGMVARESPPEVRRPLSTLRREDVLRALGAGAAAIATTAWAFTQVLPLDGPVAFVVVAYLLFLGFYVALISFDEGRVTIADRLVGVVIHSGALVLLAALVVVIVFTVIRGSQALRHANFWVEDLSITGPQEPLTMGGMAHAAVGTLIMIAFALAISIPLGLACAVFLAEFPGAFARTVRTVVEAMTALPSIVCGLFIYATYVLAFGFDKSAFAASLAITIMILPIVIRSADVVLRLVPATLKEASLATG
ncbi:MAG: hypothetical protein LBJ08_09190, partial [Bifidobacteriaceae bacterium]|nr:hypothetical protein [Bifidobacteriaceae bacterium]